MLTPSGGNRANCYRFVSLVTGCSNTTIGKVNEQMKVTGKQCFTSTKQKQLSRVNSSLVTF